MPPEVNALVVRAPGLDAHGAGAVAARAARLAQQYAPKVTGRGADSIEPYWGPGFFGVTWDSEYLWFVERGASPFTMRSLAGKTVPMWIEDYDGSETLKVPPGQRARRTRMTRDGRKQVLIFRKAAPVGSRKTVVRNGVTVSVPRSYPGAPGRIARRHPRDTGKIGFRNVGVRWRHPGVDPRHFMSEALRDAARDYGLAFVLAEPTRTR